MFLLVLLFPQGIHADFTFIVENLVNSSVPVPFRVDHVEGLGELVVDGELDYESVTDYTLRVRGRFCALQLYAGISHCQ